MTAIEKGDGSPDKESTSYPFIVQSLVMMIMIKLNLN
jgi:hypothetical protein